MQTSSCSPEVVYERSTETRVKSVKNSDLSVDLLDEKSFGVQLLNFVKRRVGVRPKNIVAP